MLSERPAEKRGDNHQSDFDKDNSVNQLVHMNNVVVTNVFEEGCIFYVQKLKRYLRRDELFSH